MVEEMQEAQTQAEASAQAPADLKRLEAQVAELEAGRMALKDKLALAVAKYRAQLLSAAPEIPEELVKGESVEEVDAAFSAARDLVERVRRKLEAQVASARVPAGAPARSTPDLSALSPKEKIAYALTMRKS